MLIDKLTSNPATAPADALVAKLKDMGQGIKYNRRRFLACLPEIKRRRLWARFGYDKLWKMACHVADFSSDTVRRVISMEKKIYPFLAIRRLFERTNIGWSKFELAARVIDKETAPELLRLLKNNTSYSAIRTYVQDIEREREETQKAKEAAEAAKESAKEEVATSTSKGVEDTKKHEASSNKPEEEEGEEATRPTSNHLTSENVIKGAPFKTNHTKVSGGQTGFFSSSSEHADKGKQPAIGKLVMQGGVQVVTLTLYPRVAERLMQKVDQLGDDYSRVNGVSTVIEHLLNNCNVDIVADPKTTFLKKKKVRAKETTHVVFWDKSRDAYFARTRFGTINVPNEDMTKDGGYDKLIRMDDLYLKAKEKAAEYESRANRGEKVPRKLPAAVEKFLFYDSGGGFCQHPGCNKRAHSSHHGIAWATSPNCNPDTTYKQCFDHHELKHSGLKRYEDNYAQKGSKADRHRVDAKYRSSRKKSHAKKQTG